MLWLESIKRHSNTSDWYYIETNLDNSDSKAARAVTLTKDTVPHTYIHVTITKTEVCTFLVKV